MCVCVCVCVCVVVGKFPQVCNVAQFPCACVDIARVKLHLCVCVCVQAMRETKGFSASEWHKTFTVTFIGEEGGSN